MLSKKIVATCVVLLAIAVLLAACGGGGGSGSGGPGGPAGPKPQVQSGLDPSAGDKIRNDVAKQQQKLNESKQQHQARQNANQAQIEAQSRERAAQQSIDRAKSVVNDPKRPTP